MLKSVILSCLALLLVGCQPALVPAPDEGEARQLFDRIVELAQAHDFVGLCEVGGGNCERILDNVGRDVPDADPWIVGIRSRAPTRATPGGRVLEICGTDNDEALYYSEMVVEFIDDQLRAVEPVYWSGYLSPDGTDVGGTMGTDLTLRCAAGAPSP